MTVYVELYILINLCMNFVILHITSNIIKSKTTTSKVTLVSLLSSVISLMFIKISFSLLTKILSILIFPLLMTYITYKPKSAKLFISYTAVFYGVTFLSGGCGYALLNLMHKNEWHQTGIILLVTVIISYMIINLVSEFYEKRCRINMLSHKLKVTLNEKSIEFDCFSDTGNSLTEPISGLPVIVTSIKTMSGLLPDSFVYEFLHNTSISDIFYSFGTEIHLKLIPYHTIAESGLLLGFVPEKITIDDKEIKAVIGISPKNISHDTSYSAILNPQIII